MTILGIAGMLLIFLGLVQKEKYKLHFLHFTACILLALYAILIGDALFSVMNIIMVVVNAIQYFVEKKRRTIV